MRISNESANAGLNAQTALYNNGYLRFYNGVMPGTADSALSGHTLLAELRFNASAFAAAVNGVALANPLTQDSSADATGVATWARATKSDGAAPLADFTVATSGADINLVTTQITQTQPVQITSFQLTQPKG